MRLPNYLPARRKPYATLYSPMPELPDQPTAVELIVAGLAWLRRASDALACQRDELMLIDAMGPFVAPAEAELALARMRAYRREANRCGLWAERCGVRVAAIRWQQAVDATPDLADAARAGLVSIHLELPTPEPLGEQLDSPVSLPP